MRKFLRDLSCEDNVFALGSWEVSGLTASLIGITIMALTIWGAIDILATLIGA